MPDRLIEGIMNADKIARLLYSIDPRNFSKVDFIFTFSFAWLILAAVFMFQTNNLLIAVASLVGMFLLFTVMTLCVVMEDLFVSDDKSLKEKDEEKKKNLTSMEDLKNEI